MTELFNIGDHELTGDLASLDAELSSIRYEERPSFGPELRAELARAWAEEPTRRRSALRRHLVAATLAGLLVGGAAVPSARASFVRLIGALAPEPVELEAPAPDPTPVPVVVEEEEPVEEPSPAVEAVSAVAEEPGPVESTTSEALSEAVIFLPHLIDRAEAERLLEDAYPRYLQRQGIGGTLELRLWIEESGRTGAVEVAHSSGVADLDRVAREVAGRFQFIPAMQNGTAMGTWIEFPVRFEPDESLVDRVLKPVVDPFSLPNVEREAWWQLREPIDPAELEPAGPGASSAELLAAEAALADALDDPSILDDFGPARAILAGEPPEGIGPTRWRGVVGSALERWTCTKFVTPVDDPHLVGELSQEETLFQGAVTTSNDDDILTPKEKAVAGGAEAYSSPDKFVFSRNTQPSRGCAGGNND